MIRHGLARGPSVPPPRVADSQLTSTATRRAELVRAAAFALLLVFCLASPSAQACYVASAVVLLLTQASRKLTFIRLQIAWAMGFLFIVCREGFFDAASITQAIGPVSYLRASQYVCAANAALMLSWTLGFKEPTAYPTAAPSEAIAWRRVRSTGVILGAAYVLVFAVLVPAAIQSFQMGRNGTIDAGNDLVTNSASGVAREVVESVLSTMLPPLTIFYLRRVRRLPWLRAIAPCAAILLLDFFMGTRYLLLFSITGMAMVALAEYRLNPRIVTLLSVIAISVLVISRLMVKGLESGFGSLELSDLMSDSDAPTFHYEGVIPMLGMLMTYCDRFGQLYGRSMGGMFLFWIPRFIWADKPTLLGYWLPRELGLTHGFSGGYSAAATFAADPFADFGFMGGLIACALVGLVWARIERWVAATLRTPQNPIIVIAGPFYAAAFFAVRSFDTTLIILSGFIVLGVAFSRYISPATAPRVALASARTISRSTAKD